MERRCAGGIDAAGLARGEMGEDGLDEFGRFDARDDTQLTATHATVFDVDVEDALEPLHPAHGRGARRGRLAGGWVDNFLVRRAGLRSGAGARTGAVTLVQRFGSALNLNPHLHMLFLDGAYAFDDEAPRFHRVAAPTQAELQRLLHAIATRTTRALERQGLLSRDEETPALDLEPAAGFEQLLGAAVHYRIATGPHAARKALTLRTVDSSPPPDNPCIDGRARSSEGLARADQGGSRGSSGGRGNALRLPIGRHLYRTDQARRPDH